MTFPIRPAEPADAESITEIYLESAQLHALLDPARNYLPDRDFIIQRYRQALHAAVTLVAEDAGQVIGFLDARLEEPADPMYRPVKYCFVADIAVLASHRSRGVGEQLMHAVEHWAAGLGGKFVVLEYHTGNNRAAGFYERLGYRSASVVAIKQIQYE